MALMPLLRRAGAEADVSCLYAVTTRAGELREITRRLEYALMTPLCRDDIVGNATIAGGTTSPFSGVIYAAQVSMAFGFLDPGLQTENIDINHEIPYGLSCDVCGWWMER